MGLRDNLLPFPFTSVALKDAPPEASFFDSILEGEGVFPDFAFGYCVTIQEDPREQRYLLFFNRKPYAAGIFSGPNDIRHTTIRDFFVFLAQNPKIRLAFMKADPVLIKSILVVQDCIPETKGSSEFVRIENQVVDLMEGRKDALVALIQDGRFSFAFAKGGKVVKAYFQDQVVESSGGMEWLELFQNIEVYQIRGQNTHIRIYVDMQTSPAEDYVEGEVHFHGGVFKHFTRPLPELIIRDKVRTLKRTTVHKFPFVIGRSSEADLVLNDAGVSRQHAVIEENKGRINIRDMDSLNGIFINDHFTKQFVLQDGDKVTIGSHILQVVLPRSPAEDVSLVSTGSQDQTMAMDREARIRMTCPDCDATGFLDAKKLYSSKKIKVRCPQCRKLFEPHS